MRSLSLRGVALNFGGTLNRIRNPNLSRSPLLLIRRFSPRPRRRSAAAVASQAVMADEAKKKNQEDKLMEEEKKKKGTEELPPPPEKPLPGDCCGSGCVRCVWDVYYDELEDYNNRCKNDPESDKS